MADKTSIKACFSNVDLKIFPRVCKVIDIGKVNMLFFFFVSSLIVFMTHVVHGKYMLCLSLGEFVVLVTSNFS